MPHRQRLVMRKNQEKGEDVYEKENSKVSEW